MAVLHQPTISFINSMLLRFSSLIFVEVRYEDGMKRMILFLIWSHVPNFNSMAPSFKVLSVLEACKLTNPMLNVRATCLPQKSKQFIRRFGGGGGADGITVIAFQRLWWAYRKLGETLIDCNDRPRSCGVVFCRLEQQCECSHSSTWFLLIFAHAW